MSHDVFLLDLRSRSVYAGMDFTIVTYMCLRHFYVLSSFILKIAYKPVKCRIRPLRRTGELRTALKFRVLPEEEPRSDVLRCRKVAVIHFPALEPAEAGGLKARVFPAENFS